MMRIEKDEVKFRFRLYSNLCILLNHILLQMEGFSYTPHSDNIRILIIGWQVLKMIELLYSIYLQEYRAVFINMFKFCKPFFSNLGIKKEPRRVLFLNKNYSVKYSVPLITPTECGYLVPDPPFW